MESNGWIFNIASNGFTQPSNLYHRECGGNTWYGWSGSDVGSVKIVLIGSGLINLDYENCYHSGVVRVYLNAVLISSALANDKNNSASFRYTNGDVLKLTEEGAIIKLNSIEIKCMGKN